MAHMFCAECGRKCGTGYALKDISPGSMHEIRRLRSLLGEAAAYVEQYGDSRKDRHYVRRFRAAAEGKPEPEDPYADEEE